MTAWGRQQAVADAEAGRPTARFTDEEQAQTKQLGEQLGACMTKAMTAGSGGPP